MGYLKRVAYYFVTLNLLSLGIWLVVFTIIGLWAKDAAHIGYHSTASDTSYLSLKTLIKFVILARAVQVAVIAFLPRMTRKYCFICIGLVENLLWFSIALTNYGSNEWLTIGYFYLLAFTVLSNSALVIGLIIGLIVKTSAKKP